MKAKVVKRNDYIEDAEEEESSLFKLLGKITLNTISLLVVAYILPGFILENIGVAVVASIVIGVINTFIRPVLQILALPFSIMTLGITAFLINVGLLILAAAIVPGFEIDSFFTAAVASILLTLANAFLHKLAK